MTEPQSEPTNMEETPTWRNEGSEYIKVWKSTWISDNDLTFNGGGLFVEDKDLDEVNTD